MSARSSVLAMAIAGCALVTAPVVAPPGKRLVLNTTASAPLGFYWLRDGAVSVGDLALVRPPRPLARWMAVRGYLPLNVPLIKRVAAKGGQSVCVRDAVVSLDGRPIAGVLQRDRQGRPLAASSICRRLGPDEVFLLNAEARSLDGRYFGPLPRHCVVGRLTPVWTWGR